MLRNPALCRTAGQPALLNEVLSLNAQESLAVRRQAHGRLLLNEVPELECSGIERRVAEKGRLVSLLNEVLSLNDMA